MLVIGDLGTGKTSIIKRYVHQFFSPHYRAVVDLLYQEYICTLDYIYIVIVVIIMAEELHVLCVDINKYSI